MMEMNMKACERFRTLLDAYLDGALGAEEVSFMQAHAAECEDCARELRLAREMMEYIGTLDDDVVVPLNVQAAWRQAVRREARQKKVSRFTRWASGIAAALVVIAGSTALLKNSDEVVHSAEVTGQSDTARRISVPASSEPMMFSMRSTDWALFEADGGEKQAVATGAVFDLAAAETEEAALDDIIVEDAAYECETEEVPAEEAQPVASEPSMMVKSANVVAYADNFDQSRKNLITLTEEYSGYFASDVVETTSTAQRLSRCVVRVPMELMDEFVTALENIAEISSVETRNENVSEYYYDAESRCASQRAMIDRLNELILTASGSELKTLNQQLQEAYDRVDELEKIIHAYEGDISYASVTLTLYEITGEKGFFATDNAPAATKEPTLSERSASGFKQSMKKIGSFFEDMIVSLAIIAPVVLIVAAVSGLVGAAIWIVRSKKKKTKTDDEKSEGE